jgi:hypothetical protein
MTVQRNYVGQGGQQAFVAELLFRGCNAAMPLVDRGLDVFAFLDDSEEIARVQVKTGTADRYKRGDGYSVQFGIPLKQLNADDRPRLFYGLVVRLDAHVVDFFILSRKQLYALWKGRSRLGTSDDENLVLTLQCREHVISGEVDLTEFRNAWHLLPPFQTPAGTAPPATADENPLPS